MTSESGQDRSGANRPLNGLRFRVVQSPPDQRSLPIQVLNLQQLQQLQQLQSVGVRLPTSPVVSDVRPTPVAADAAGFSNNGAAVFRLVSPAVSYSIGSVGSAAANLGAAAPAAATVGDSQLSHFPAILQLVTPRSTSTLRSPPPLKPPSPLNPPPSLNPPRSLGTTVSALASPRSSTATSLHPDGIVVPSQLAATKTLDSSALGRTLVSTVHALGNPSSTSSASSVPPGSSTSKRLVNPKDLVAQLSSIVAPGSSSSRPPRKEIFDEPSTPGQTRDLSMGQVEAPRLPNGFSSKISHRKSTKSKMLNLKTKRNRSLLKNLVLKDPSTELEEGGGGEIKKRRIGDADLDLNESSFRLSDDDDSHDDDDDDGALSQEEIKTMLKLRQQQIHYEQMYSEDKDFLYRDPDFLSVDDLFSEHQRRPGLHSEKKARREERKSTNSKLKKEKQRRRRRKQDGHVEGGGGAGAGAEPGDERFAELAAAVVKNVEEQEEREDGEEEEVPGVDPTLLRLVIKQAKLARAAGTLPSEFYELGVPGFPPLTEAEKAAVAAATAAATVNADSSKEDRRRRGDPRRADDRRRKIWLNIGRRDVPRAVKARTAARAIVLANVRRVSRDCMRRARQFALQSSKIAKETAARQRRLVKEIQLYWKRMEREEKEQRRRAEREATEQRKLEAELREAKRQNRKLNFLITQTELYAHFMARKLEGGAENHRPATAPTTSKRRTKEEILEMLDERHADNPVNLVMRQWEAKAREAGGLVLDDEDFDVEATKSKALNQVQAAFDTQSQWRRSFPAPESDSSWVGADCEDDAAAEKSAGFSLTDPTLGTDKTRMQPRMFCGELKNYQLKGMNWLVNLYDQGINGILADEMGLGKTVQTIAFLAHLAEAYSIWGPFLVVAPASTLHNWQQEISRFAPNFKVLPYWGNIVDRKTLRQSWSSAPQGSWGLELEESEIPLDDSSSSSSSFHVLITSYQLVVQDAKYFQRVKWQYMILDEAQAVKSSASVRWKNLLTFQCRNRLLLTGTPIQNTMAELWALLHFIMPTLFDSHHEFNDWFSKDIESHVENKTSVDEKQISRLHMILKPFMLRRVKKDVEHELADKLEVLVYCPLTRRQKWLYQGIKKKISIDDLLQSTGSSAAQAQSTLMNLVMQFRKVCNHPELFERRETHSPLFLCERLTEMLTRDSRDTAISSSSSSLFSFRLPKLIFREGIFWKDSPPSKRHLFEGLFDLFQPVHVCNDIFSAESRPSCFSFARLLGLSPRQLFLLFRAPPLTGRWRASFEARGEDARRALDVVFKEGEAAEMREVRTTRFASPSLDIRPYLSDSRIRFSSFSSPLLRRTFLPPIIPSSPSSPNLPPLPLLPPLIFTSPTSDFLSFVDVVVSSSSSSSGRPNKGKSSLSAASSPLPLPPRSLPPPPRSLPLQPFHSPPFLISPGVYAGGAVASFRDILCSDASSFHLRPSLDSQEELCLLLRGCDFFSSSSSYSLRSESPISVESVPSSLHPLTATPTFSLSSTPSGGLLGARPTRGWSFLQVPKKESLIHDSGKLSVLDSLLSRLKGEGHRVLIYSQMTKMIDLLEEYMWHRKYKYMRLDGSSKIIDRRDMVADFQAKADIFVFLLSTRAGGLGINLTAADTVVFYDSDWNPTVDQQAMDRAHRLGQTKQVTVYRLICKGTIEERMLQRAREKSEIQRVVISGGHFRPEALKPKEVVSLLLDDDDEELERKLRSRNEERSRSSVSSPCFPSIPRRRGRPPLNSLHAASRATWSHASSHASSPTESDAADDSASSFASRRRREALMAANRCHPGIGDVFSSRDTLESDSISLVSTTSPPASPASSTTCFSNAAKLDDDSDAVGGRQSPFIPLLATSPGSDGALAKTLAPPRAFNDSLPSMDAPPPVSFPPIKRRGRPRGSTSKRAAFSRPFPAPPSLPPGSVFPPGTSFGFNFIGGKPAAPAAAPKQRGRPRGSTGSRAYAASASARSAYGNEGVRGSRATARGAVGATKRRGRGSRGPRAVRGAGRAARGVLSGSRISSSSSPQSLVRDSVHESFAQDHPLEPSTSTTIFGGEDVEDYDDQTSGDENDDDNDDDETLS